MQIEIMRAALHEAIDEIIDGYLDVGSAPPSAATPDPKDHGIEVVAGEDPGPFHYQTPGPKDDGIEVVAGEDPGPFTDQKADPKDDGIEVVAGEDPGPFTDQKSDHELAEWR